MKHVICRSVWTLCTFLLCISVSAQQKTLDSLQAELKKATGTVRVDLLNKLANPFWNPDLSNAEALLKEAEALSTQLKYERGRLAAEINEARICYFKKEYAAAIKQADKAMLKARVAKVYNELANLYEMKIQVYRDQGKYPKSLEMADEYLDFATEQNNNVYMAYAHKERATTCYFMGNLNCALEHFEQAMVLYEKVDNYSASSGMGMNLGIILYRSGRASESLRYFDRAIQAFEKLGDTSNVANALINQGLSEEKLGRNKEAMAKYKRAYTLYKKTKNETGCANTSEIIGNVYNLMGDYASSLKYLMEALKFREKNKDKRAIAISYANIGAMYATSRDTNKAIEYVTKAKNINKEIGNDYSYGNNLSRLGSYYLHRKKYSEAEALLRESVAVRKKVGDMPGLANSYVDMGNLHFEQKNEDSALVYYLRALEVNKSSEDMASLAGVYYSIGNLYKKKGHYREALPYLLKAENMQESMSDNFNLSSTHLALSEAFAATNEYKKAYDYYHLFHTATDSMFNVNMSKAMAEMQTKYGVEKKQKENEILRQKSKLDQAEIQRKEEAHKKQQVIIYAILGVVALVVVLLVVVLRSNVQRKKTNQRLEEQNQKISQQKHIIEEKNKDITDSISYAKRIQEAILPPDKLIRQYLNESFVLYKPKDIVSGDFYWMEPLDDKILFAVVDCTGHGVPGAFVSIVGHNNLNRTVKEYGLRKPAQILDKLNELVEETFDVHGSGLKDGMDISLCAIDLKTRTLEWAGANNPLWLIKNDGNFVEVKPDKQPIGKHIDRKPFTGHVFQLERGDAIYIFSDGYADQFGGPVGKKFKHAQLRDILISINKLSMGEQRDFIREKLDAWRGELEQIDDVCVIGLRV